jgi:hypothetical protein
MENETAKYTKYTKGKMQLVLGMAHPPQTSFKIPEQVGFAKAIAKIATTLFRIVLRNVPKGFNHDSEPEWSTRIDTMGQRKSIQLLSDQA